MAQLKNLECIDNKGDYAKLSVDFTASSTTEKAYYRIQCKLISSDQSEEYDFLSSEGGALVTANTTYTFTIECSDLSTNTTYECYCYVDYRGVNDTTWTATDVGTQMTFTTLDESEVSYSLGMIETGEDYIQFQIFIDPSPDDLDMYYEYNILIKSDSDDTYSIYDFIDTAPNITDSIKLLYGITPGTTYKIYAEIWYLGTEIVGTTPVYTITTKEPEGVEPKISIVSMNRTTNDFTITVRNTSVVEQPYTIIVSRRLDQKGTDIAEYVTFSPNEIKTFTYHYSSYYHDYPFFVWFSGEYQGDDWFYPTEEDTVRAEDGSRFEPFKSTAGYASYYIKVDITQDFPWDNAPYMLNTSSPQSYSEFCWKQYEGDDNYILNGHKNIYQSTNHHVHSSNSSILIEMNLKYPCQISFNYAIDGHYGYNQNSADYLYQESLMVKFDDAVTTAVNRGRDGAWRNYTVECTAGNHILKLVYRKDEKYNAYGDCAYFADFKITPCVPKPWDWTKSNGTASDTQTDLAHTAITSRGKTSAFSHLVWNDMIDKTKHILDYKSKDYLGGIWDTSSYECGYKNVLMNTDILQRKLTALKFNSLTDNILKLIDPSCDEYKTIAQWFPVEPGDVVYGKYFEDLTAAINKYINDTASI